MRAIWGAVRVLAMPFLAMACGSAWGDTENPPERIPVWGKRIPGLWEFRAPEGLVSPPVYALPEDPGGGGGGEVVRERPPSDDNTAEQCEAETTRPVLLTTGEKLLPEFDFDTNGRY